MKTLVSFVDYTNPAPKLLESIKYEIQKPDNIHHWYVLSHLTVLLLLCGKKLKKKTL